MDATTNHTNEARLPNSVARLTDTDLLNIIMKQRGDSPFVQLESGDIVNVDHIERIWKR